jgi:hypothetical protein
MDKWEEGCGAYQGTGRVVIDSVVGIGSLLQRRAHDPHEFRMLLGSFLSLFLVSFVYAQLLAQDNTDPELQMMSETGSGDDHPGHIPLDVENYPFAPPTLQLEQVHLFIRHGAFGRSFVQQLSYGLAGERTPVSIRMSEAPANIPPRWLLCKEGRKFEAAVANLTGSSTLRIERVVEKEDGSLESGEW